MVLQSSVVARRVNWHYLQSLLFKPTAKVIQQIHAQLLVFNASELMPHMTTTTITTVWNSLLRHYALGSFPEEALQLFKHLQLQQHPPVSFDSFSYSFLIKACAILHHTNLGTQLHCLSVKAGFQFHLYVQTALVNMYAVCGSLVEAQRVFDQMPERNSVTWNALITGFIKWGELHLAHSLFDRMPTRTVVSWTGIIDGYARTNQHKTALFLFRIMVGQEGIKPSQITILAIFPAIWNLGCLESCQSIHVYGYKSGFDDIRVLNSLVDAYAKCGCMESAAQIFESMPHKKRNLVSWTSIISGFAMHGMLNKVMDIFKSMEDECLKPNRVTFLSILSACSHGGFIEEGLEFFRKMVDEYRVEPDIKHYGCLIDMLGRSGRLEEAEKIALNVSPEIDSVVIWRTLLGACSFHGNVVMGERVMRKILEMERRYGGDYVLLSNLFAGYGRFVDAENVRTVMDDRNAFKVPGLSLA